MIGRKLGVDVERTKSHEEERKGGGDRGEYIVVVEGGLGGVWIGLALKGGGKCGVCRSERRLTEEGFRRGRGSTLLVVESTI